MLDAAAADVGSVERKTRRAIIICNLGGADGPDSVRPFLFNLFSDRNIIPLPGWIRLPLAALISTLRAPYTRKLYSRQGGRSILYQQTAAQARALEAAAATPDREVKVVIAMRYWHPMAAQAIAEVEAFAPDEIVVVPLYPQFSATTTTTILDRLREEARARNLKAKVSAVCCYPRLGGFVGATAELIKPHLDKLLAAGVRPRLLLSAHGLPKKLIARGDPYQWQVEQTAAAVVAALAAKGFANLDWRVCYQSRLGPMWLGPHLEDEIRAAGAEKLGLVVVPFAFVSEHLETVVELDHTMRVLAREAGVPAYERVPAVGVARAFIEGLKELTEAAAGGEHIHCDGGTRLCPRHFALCPHAG
jgi:ferrochelatase